MALLAIKGHPTRGNEVIEILEMLGGKNDNHCCGGFINRIYFINENGYIESCDKMHHLDYSQLTLEEFLEKFPYKVGDKVSVLKGSNYIFTIKSMTWETDIKEVSYRMEAIDGMENEYDWFADDLISYSEQKEETMENKPDLLQQLKDYFDNTPREVVEKEWHEYDKYNEIGPTVDEYLEYVNKIRQPKYPKTYEECCEVLDIESEWHLTFELNNSASCNLCINKEFEYICKLEAFRKLLICRDAYWKIAGEQMGLDKPWEYDMSKDEFSYAISYQYGYIQKNEIRHKNTIFAFPTVEMRDAFKENFDDDIEFCKEFL